MDKKYNNFHSLDNPFASRFRRFLRFINLIICKFLLRSFHNFLNPVSTKFGAGRCTFLSVCHIFLYFGLNDRRINRLHHILGTKKGLNIFQSQLHPRQVLHFQFVGSPLQRYGKFYFYQCVDMYQLNLESVQ